jgi:PAP2 superfamily
MLDPLDRVSRRGVNQDRGLLTRFWEARYGGVLLREFVLLAVMLYLYKYVRFLARHQTADAFQNADRVLDLERVMGLGFEAPLQQLVLPYRDVITVFNRYYVSVHFLGTVAFVVWAFVRSLPGYRKVRSVLVAVTLGSLVLHVLFPLAPPRMMPGFVDTMVLYGPNPYNSEAVRSFANQYAAMPSLHVGWALVVAYGVIALSRSRFRWAILAHPIMTMFAVTVTANHYWLDGAVSAVLVAWAVFAIARPQEQREPRGTLVGATG